MTEPTPESAVVRAVANTKLDDLLYQYAELKPKVDAFTEALKSITDSIKAEAIAAAPDGRTAVEIIAAPGFHDVHLRLSYVESWRLDSKKLKAEQTETWVRYARKCGSWTLKAVTS